MIPLSVIVVQPLNIHDTSTSSSDDFLNELGSLARDFEAALIVDERDTGCGASGKGFWNY